MPKGSRWVVRPAKAYSHPNSTARALASEMTISKHMVESGLNPRDKLRAGDIENAVMLLFGYKEFVLLSRLFNMDRKPSMRVQGHFRRWEAQINSAISAFY
jgi:hypothetical protein